MITNRFFRFSAAVVAGLTVSSTSLAQEFYLSGSLGMIDQDDSSNVGIFTSDFVTGDVTGVSPPLTIPLGSPVSWDSDFDSGDFYSLAIGTELVGFRFELEYRTSEADVESHRGVSAAGIDLSNIDAGVLITGNAGDLGISTADLVAAGRGEYETDSIMVNAYYDFDLDGPWTPYIGVGIGNADTDVSYRPSDTPVLSGGDSGFAYQLIGGIGYDISDSVQVYLNYRYFDTEDFSVGASLLPATFEIENQSQTFDLGLRFSF